MPSLLDLQLTYRLSPTLAKLLLLLLENKFVTARMVEAEHRLTTDAKIAMHRLRRRLDGLDVTIQSQRSLGYWLDEPTKQLIKQSASLDAPVAPLGSAEVIQSA